MHERINWFQTPIEGHEEAGLLLSTISYTLKVLLYKKCKSSILQNKRTRTVHHEYQLPQKYV
jgi:hypothetical protein